MNKPFLTLEPYLYQKLINYRPPMLQTIFVLLQAQVVAHPPDHRPRIARFLPGWCQRHGESRGTIPSYRRFYVCQTITMHIKLLLEEEFSLLFAAHVQMRPQVTNKSSKFWRFGFNMRISLNCTVHTMAVTCHS